MKYRGIYIFIKKNIDVHTGVLKIHIFSLFSRHFLQLQKKNWILPCFFPGCKAVVCYDFVAPRYHGHSLSAQFQKFYLDIGWKRPMWLGQLGWLGWLGQLGSTNKQTVRSSILENYFLKIFFFVSLVSLIYSYLFELLLFMLVLGEVILSVVSLIYSYLFELLLFMLVFGK